MKSKKILLLSVLLPFTASVLAIDVTFNGISVVADGVVQTFYPKNYLPTSKKELTPYLKGLFTGIGTNIVKNSLDHRLAQCKLKNSYANAAKDIVVESVTTEYALLVQEGMKERWVGSGQLSKESYTALVKKRLLYSLPKRAAINGVSTVVSKQVPNDSLVRLYGCNSESSAKEFATELKVVLGQNNFVSPFIAAQEGLLATDILPAQKIAKMAIEMGLEAVLLDNPHTISKTNTKKVNAFNKGLNGAWLFNKANPIKI